MKVTIKSFDVGMEVKAKGIEFQIHSSDGKKHLGDIVLSMAGLTWCKGKTTREKGIRVSFDEFTKWVEQKEAEAKAKAAKKKGK